MDSQKLLQEIRDSLLPKENFSLVVSSKTTDWMINFSPALYLNPKKKYEMALINLETYNSIPNITDKNNSFIYNFKTGQKNTAGDDFWEYDYINIPKGCYEIEQINNEIQRQLKIKGHEDSGISIRANKATLRSIIEVKSNKYGITLIETPNITSLLGFKPQRLIKEGPFIHESENPVDIMSINSIMVNCDMITGSYLNGVEQPVVYAFFPNVSPGYKIVETPHTPVFLPINLTGGVHQMRVWLTDQNAEPLDLQNETVSIRFHIRQS